MKYIGLWVILVILTVLILIVTILIDFGKIKTHKEVKEKRKQYSDEIEKLKETYSILVNEFNYSYKLHEYIHFNFIYNDKEYDVVVSKKEIYINNNFIKCKYVEEPFEKMIQIIRYILEGKDIYNYKKEIVNL